MIGQIVNTVEYKVSYHDETFDYPIDKHLNEIGKQGWFLHSMIDTEVLVPSQDGEPYSYISYRCIWQKITQNSLGLLVNER